MPTEIVGGVDWAKVAAYAAAGFCMGVRRALDITLSVANKGD